MLLICEQCGKEFFSERSKRKYCSVKCAGIANGKKRADANIEISDIVFSSGGGVQSTAIAVLIARGVLPRPRLGVMVDVGLECKHTLDYMRKITIPRLADVGVPMEIIDAQQYTDVSVVDADGLVRIPAYRINQDLSVDKFRTYCNGAWKVAVTKRIMKDRGIDACVNWVGISTDERRRARGGASSKRFRVEYPLISLGMSRDDCVQIIRDAGWPMPERSACFCCPSRSDKEWAVMRYKHPEDFERACAVDREIRARVPGVFLHRSCKPLDDLF